MRVLILIAVMLLPMLASAKEIQPFAVVVLSDGVEKYPAGKALGTLKGVETARAEKLERFKIFLADYNVDGAEAHIVYEQKCSGTVCGNLTPILGKYESKEAAQKVCGAFKECEVLGVPHVRQYHDTLRTAIFDDIRQWFE